MKGIIHTYMYMYIRVCFLDNVFRPTCHWLRVGSDR